MNSFGGGEESTESDYGAHDSRCDPSCHRDPRDDSRVEGEEADVQYVVRVSTEDLMQWCAAEAVDIADKNYGVRLDFTTGSIEKVEEVLAKIHDDYQRRKTEEGVNGLAMAFGAYIGESIRRAEPDSKWERDHPFEGEKSYPLHWHGRESFPCTWCYKRILNGAEDNVWHKYLITCQLIEESQRQK